VSTATLEGHFRRSAGRPSGEGRARVTAPMIWRGPDPARKVAILIVSIMAAIATFFLVGALLDTR
jgi:hypothetical protein